MILHRRSLLAALGLLPLAAPARAQPPPWAAMPPPRQEVVPAKPGQNLVWQPGHWRWDGRDYVWIGGRWIEPAGRGRRWVPGHWQQFRGQWVWVEPHWR
jgi:hypothetical protein